MVKEELVIEHLLDTWIAWKVDQALDSFMSNNLSCD